MNLAADSQGKNYKTDLKECLYETLVDTLVSFYILDNFCEVLVPTPKGRSSMTLLAI